MLNPDEPLQAETAAAIRRMIQRLGLKAQSHEIAAALDREGITASPGHVSEVQANLAAGAATGDAVEHVPSPPQSGTDRLANELGFASYLALFEGSTPLTREGDKAWFITRVPNNQWALWNDRDLKVVGYFHTQVEALAHASASR